MNLPSLLCGINMATFAASGVFFFKFYRRLNDRFFLYFALACWLLSLERIILFNMPDPFPSVSTPQNEGQSWVYLVRMVAFLIIVVAVIEKNRKESRGG